MPINGKSEKQSGKKIWETKRKLLIKQKLMLVVEILNIKV